MDQRTSLRHPAGVTREVTIKGPPSGTHLIELLSIPPEVLYFELEVKGKQEIVVFFATRDASENYVPRILFGKDFNCLTIKLLVKDKPQPRQRKTTRANNIAKCTVFLPENIKLQFNQFEVPAATKVFLDLNGILDPKSFFMRSVGAKVVLDNVHTNKFGLDLVGGTNIHIQRGLCLEMCAMCSKAERDTLPDRLKFDPTFRVTTNVITCVPSAILVAKSGLKHGPENPSSAAVKVEYFDWGPIFDRDLHRLMSFQEFGVHSFGSSWWSLSGDIEAQKRVAFERGAFPAFPSSYGFTGSPNQMFNLFAHLAQKPDSTFHDLYPTMRVSTNPPSTTTPKEEPKEEEEEEESKTKEAPQCKICMDKPIDKAGSCGHTLCTACAVQVKGICPICRSPTTFAPIYF